jgi:hypothetical protein
MVLERDFAKAMEWYGKASAAGVAMATHNMALMHREGTGVPVDHKRAVEMLLSAARLGMSASMYALGTMYEAGSHGLNKDLVQAIVWYAMAMQFQRAHPATQGSDLAMRAELKMTELRSMLPDADLQRAQALGEREYRVIIATMRAADKSRPAAPAAAPKPADPGTPAPGPSAERVSPPPPAPPQDQPPASTPQAPSAPAPAPEPQSAARPDAKAPEAAPPSAAPPAGADERLADIQRMLASLRLYGGKVDGKMGPQTRKAIRDYQRMNRMPQTGEPTPKLVEMLRKQVEQKPKR